MYLHIFTDIHIYLHIDMYISIYSPRQHVKIKQNIDNNAQPKWDG